MCPSYPSGACRPSLDSGPDEKILGFSLSALCMLLTWGSDLASPGAFGSQALPGSPGPEVSPRGPSDGEPWKVGVRGLCAGISQLANLQTELYPLGSTVKANAGSHVWAISSLGPTRYGVATIPARSSLEETSLGELLPGSILSDSLKTKIFTRSEGLRCMGGGGGAEHMYVYNWETGLLLKTMTATDPGILRGLLQVPATSESPRDFHDQEITVRRYTVQKSKHLWLGANVYMLQTTLRDRRT